MEGTGFAEFIEAPATGGNWGGLLDYARARPLLMLVAALAALAGLYYVFYYRKDGGSYRTYQMVMADRAARLV